MKKSSIAVNEILKMATEEPIITFSGESLLEIILVDYRWIIVCFVLLPMSFLYNLWYYVRNIIIFQLNSAPKSHLKKVQNIQKQVMLVDVIGIKALLDVWKFKLN